MPAIEILLEHDTAGDAISGLRWTRQTPHKMAQLLEQTGIAVWANTVARLLHQMNYSSASPTMRWSSSSDPAEASILDGLRRAHSSCSPAKM